MHTNHPKAATRFRWRRPALLWAALPLALAAALAAAEVAGWPFLRAPLQQVLSQQLQRPVALQAPFGLRLLGPPRLHAAGLVIGAQASAPGQPDLVRAQGLQLSLPWATLWQLARGAGAQPLVIHALVVEHLQALLLRDAQQRANWQLPVTGAPLPLRLGRLLVRSGDVHVDDLPLQLRLQAQVRTQEGSSSDGTAPGLDVQARGSYRGAPLTAHLQSSGVLPLLRSSDNEKDPHPDSSAPLRLDLQAGRAHLKLDGRASDALSLGGLDAAFELSGPSLAAVGDALGLTLPTTAAFDMRGRINKTGAVWAASVAAWRVGDSRLSGEFLYHTARTPPLLTGSLAGVRLMLVDLGPAIGAPADQASAAKPSSRVLPQREFDIPSLQRMDADVTLRLNRLDLGTSQLESLAPLQGRLRLQNGVLGMQDLLAHTAGGTLRGEFSLDARKPATPLWRTDLRWSGIALERFVKVRKPAATAAPGYVAGALGGVLKANGHGRSIAAVMATLDGTAGLWVREGSVSHLLVELAGIDVAESLGVWIRGDTPMPLRCAVTQWTLRDGLARPDAALVDTRDTTFLVSGEVSLAQERLALMVTAQPHDWSPLTLRSPLHISGTFAAPQVQLDRRRIALRLAGAAALGALAPAAALLALVDLGEADQQLCAQALQPNPPAQRKTKSMR